MARRALARVNLGAIERNTALLRSGLEPGTRLCAVVKADGYGHGAAAAARAARAAGAQWLAVATAGEAAELREAGLAPPILVMGALSGEELELALDAGADVVAWDTTFCAELARRAAAIERPAAVHVKLDTGMGRLGTRVSSAALAVAEAVDAAPALRLAGAMTHFASADEDPEFTAQQLSRFLPFADTVRRQAPGALRHAANSAATLCHPDSRLDLVRCGIALYGTDPLHEDPGRWGLEPALELTSYVAAVKPAAPGESAGYGRRFVAERGTLLATVPIGYGDGVRRAFTNNLEVLIGGRRHPLVGTVSMDNITVELGPGSAVAVGDPVTLIGAQGEERVTAEELARRIGTINYEILCGLSPRVERRHHRDGEPA